MISDSLRYSWFIPLMIGWLVGWLVEYLHTIRIYNMLCNRKPFCFIFEVFGIFSNIFHSIEKKKTKRYPFSKCKSCPFSLNDHFSLLLISDFILDSFFLVDWNLRILSVCIWERKSESKLFKMICFFWILSNFFLCWWILLLPLFYSLFIIIFFLFTE